MQGGETTRGYIEQGEGARVAMIEGGGEKGISVLARRVVVGVHG